jgi:ABC-type Mn2+/Zn2+ transport system ATPase subunit
MSIRDNFTLASLRSVSTLGFLSTPSEERQASDLIKQLNIVARSSEQFVATLSGGNQQKCVLGKSLSTAPRLLMLDEATRGIDVGAKAQIHNLINQIAESRASHPHDQQRAAGTYRRLRPRLCHARGRGGFRAGGGPNLTQERVVASMV